MLCKICSGIIKYNSHQSTCRNFCRFYQTHYEALKLHQKCTSQEIKAAFIKLSKEYHPDVNNHKQSHAKFLRISEAYKVLSKPETRRLYDLGLARPDYVPHEQSYTTTNVNNFYNPHKDPLFWETRDRNQDKFYKNRSYYGINGVPRLPNEAIAFFCVIFCLIGVWIQYMAITESGRLHRKELIKKSQEYEETLTISKNNATQNGNERQLEILKARLLINETKK